MKTLIVYYSFTRNNEQLASTLRARLSCDVCKIEEKRKRTGLTILLDLVFNRDSGIKPHPHVISSYDHCIFIAPVWAGKIATPLKSFLKYEKYNINSYSFITVCGGMPKQKEKLKMQLTKLAEKAPLQIEELWVNDLLTEEKKNTIRNTSGYRIQPDDLKTFSKKIDDFINKLEAPSVSRKVLAEV